MNPAGRVRARLVKLAALLVLPSLAVIFALVWQVAPDLRHGDTALWPILLLSTAVPLGFVGALRVARGIAGPVESMGQAARALADGGTWTAVPPGPLPGLAEADDVGRALSAAIRMLAEQAIAQAATKASLAARVLARTDELARANTALGNQQRQLGAMLDNMPVGVVVHLADGTLHFVNLEARRLLDLPAQGEIDAVAWPTAYRGLGILDSADLPSARARTGGSVRRELLTLHPADRPPIDIEVNASPLRDLDGRVTLGLTTIQDVTARLEAEESRRRSQRLEAVGQLTGGVAHEFNNLLMAISGCLELLSPYVDAALGHNSRAAGLLANAARAAGRGAGLTGQLLAFARRQNLRVEPVDLNALVAGMAPLLEGTLGRTVQVDFQPDPECWPALADAAQLELAVLNLAINARDAMPGGGRLTISTARTRTGPPARSEGPPEGDFAVIHVADTGNGMVPAVLARAFEPFFTTKDAGRGSGLGLPHVLGVAQQLGGGVNIASNPGQGTCISMFLPRSHAGVVLPDPGIRAVPDAHALAGSRLLVVDDDADVREATRSLLEELGAEVLEADGAAAALLHLRTTHVDLLLADLTMPGMDGRQLAAEAARLLPSLPVVLMTGDGSAALAEPGPNVREILRKPFRAEALARVLARELARKLAMAEV